MAARTPQEAVRTFAAACQQALSCLTTAHFNVEGHRPIGLPYRADLQRGQAVPLVGTDLALVVALRYGLAEATEGAGWRLSVAGYHYELLGGEERELVTYHWHPHGAGPVTWPHLHLGPASGELVRPVSRAHFPTGPVTLVDLLRLAIREFGVTARRADWEAVLLRSWPVLLDAQP